MTPKLSHDSAPEDFPSSVVRKESIDYSFIGSNPGFNPIEFDGIRIQAGLNSFVLTNQESHKWGSSAKA
jgi:hypothetical protein